MFTRSSTTTPIVIAAAALIAGLLIGAGSPTALVALVLLNIVALVFALLARRSSGAIDPFEPVCVFVAAWAVMFVLRPIGMLAFDDTTLRGIYDVSSGLPFALLLASVGAVAFGAGYATSRARALADGVRIRAPQWGVRPGVGNAIALLCIALAAAGGIANSANVGTAYVSYLPLLAVPGSLLLLVVQRSRWSVAPLIAAGALVLPLLQGLAVGQRSTVLFVGGSVVVFYYLRRNRRPKSATFLIGTLLFVLLVVNGLEVLRGPALAGQPFDPTLVAAEDFAPDAAVKRLLTGASTEMLPALALQVETEGTTWTFTPGYLVAAVATHWVPGGFWADKPLSSAELLYSRFFPEYYFYSKANAQFSVLGDFYFDLGALGVALGMFALGFGARLMQGLLSGASTSQAALLLYSPFIPLFVVGLRGDIPLTLGLALYIYVPLVVAVAASGTRRRPSRVARSAPRHGHGVAGGRTRP